MRVDIITLFPDMFEGPFGTSMLKKAQDKGLADINFVDLRKFGVGPRRQVDDTPYGGGAGMVLRTDVVVPAIEHAKSKIGNRKSKIVLLTPQGKTYSQPLAKQLSNAEHLILVCGHYEGFDERIREFVDLEVSIGNYVLTGGEIPAMVLVDSVVRLIPGVLGSEDSAREESFTDGKTIEYPQYTRPPKFRDLVVPEVLLTGDHAKIKTWRAQQSKKRTQSRTDDSS